MAKNKKRSSNKALVEGLDKERIVINSEFDKLVEKLSDSKYSNQKYTSDKSVTIPGDLFAQFTNTAAIVKDSLGAIEQQLNSALTTINILQNELAKVTVELGRAHIANVDAGYTETVETKED